MAAPKKPGKPDPKEVAAKAIGKAASKAKTTKPPAPKGKTARKPAKAAIEQQAAAPAPPDEDAESDPLGALMGLSVREARFVDLYLASYNAERSYIEAGFNAKPGASAQAAASRLLGTVKCRAYMAKRMKEMFARLEDQQDTLMRSLTHTAFADAREISEHYRGACRFCYGKFHRYQYTAGEWDQAMTKHAERQEKAEEEGKSAPKALDPKGGVGYDLKREPHPDCPECGGLGIGRTIIKDTRHLSPAAVALYAGTKEGKDGVEGKMHDQLKAREMLAKVFKLYEDATNVNVKIDMAELDAKYGATMRAAHERMEQMRQEREAERAKRGD